MNYISSMFCSCLFVPIIVGVGLFVSGNLIAGFANTNMSQNTDKRALVTAKKLDVNNDGLISLDELTSHRSRPFQELDHKGDGHFDEIEFNSQLVAMFKRMDNNSDGMLDDDEIANLKHSHRGNRI